MSWNHKHARILMWLALFVYDFCFLHPNAYLFGFAASLT